MPVAKATKTHASFLVGGIPRIHLQSIRDLAASRGVPLYAFVREMLADIHAAMHHPHKITPHFQSRGLVPSIVKGYTYIESALLQTMIESGVTATKSQVHLLAKLIEKLTQPAKVGVEDSPEA